MRTDIATRRDDIEKWISEDRPKAYICRQLRCKPETLEGWFGKLGISYKGNQGGRGKKVLNRKSALEYSKGLHPKDSSVEN